MIRLSNATLLALGLLLSASSAPASEFLLSNGGRVHGELVNVDQRPRTTYVIKTAAGGRLTLARSQVKRIVNKTPLEQLYEKLRPQASDTVEDQTKLADWCRDNRLKKQRVTHLRRIIELDPDNVKARALLGYKLDEGKWKTQREIMEGQGFIRSQGKWRTVQEIELLDKSRRQQDREREWFAKIKRWRNDLDGRHADEARQSLLAIDDPAAVKSIGKKLEDEKSYEVRMLYLEVLSNIDGPAAAKILMEQSIEAKDVDERLTAMEYVVERKNPEVTAYFVGKLRSKLNYEVNRAARVLGQIKDLSSIEPLIDKLITKHKYRIVKGGGPNQISQSFNTNPNGGGQGFGGGGHSFGGKGPQYVYKYHQNGQVLQALTALTGQNFNFDTVLWKSWFKGQRRAEHLNGRRD